MTDDEILELIPEPHYSRMVAWLEAGHTGTIMLTVIDGVIVDVEMCER